MAKKLILGLILACFSPSLVPKKFLLGFTSTRCYTWLQAITVYNSKENYWTKLEKAAKNLVLGPNLVPLLQIVSQKFFMDFTSTRCSALMQAIIVCNFKEN